MENLREMREGQLQGALTEIERLRQQVEDLNDVIQKQIYVNTELRQQNAELVYAVKWIVTEDERSDPFRMACAIDHAKEMLAKATGG